MLLNFGVEPLMLGKTIIDGFGFTHAHITF
jgi:hypothetical protein